MNVVVPGDVWSWNVAVRYADAGGTLLDDRERWTVRIGKGGGFAVERVFLGTMMDDGALVPSANPKPEMLKGRVEPDGTLSLKDSASDPIAARVLRRLLNPDRSLADCLPGTALVRHAVIHEAEAFLPGSGLPASLRIEATLVSARLGGKQRVPLGGTTGGTVGEGVPASPSCCRGQVESLHSPFRKVPLSARDVGRMSRASRCGSKGDHL